MYCKERKKLTTIFLDAIDKNEDAARAVAGRNCDEWREATKDTRSVCMAALAALNEHRVEHGCDEL